MTREYPRKVLITGGDRLGGVRSFAEGLRAGFVEFGIPVEIIPPARIWKHGRELRDPQMLKILSTSAVYAAPLARRALCMAHGVPCAAHQGWLKMLAILASFRLATISRGAQLVAVSSYSAQHLNAIFGLRVDAVIRNPLHPLFLENNPDAAPKREAILYAGRLNQCKNVHRLLPAMREVLDENPGLCAWVAGDGPIRAELERLAAGDKRIEFLGTLTASQVRDRMRRARVFVSANPVEPFGIVYLEALSQGCTVIMPASGGGLEIAPEEIGGAIQLFAASILCGEVAAALRRALLAAPKTVPLAAYSARAVAQAYLNADARFDAQGIFCAEASQ